MTKNLQGHGNVSYVHLRHRRATVDVELRVAHHTPAVHNGSIGFGPYIFIWVLVGGVIVQSRRLGS
jgi:hypothetical protein